MSKVEKQSIADMPEVALIDKLLNQPYGKEKGDIDIFLVSPSSPENSIAIEVKRVKLGKYEIRKNLTNINDKDRLSNGVQQANKLARLKFSQVYLYIFIVVDSKEKNIGSISYNCQTNKQNQMIDGLINETISNSLDKRVGVVKFEFAKAMDESSLFIDTGGSKLIKRAEIINQPTELNEWVLKTIKNKKHYT